MAFSLHQEPAGRGVVIHVAGELDLATSRRLEESLIDQVAPLCVVDLSKTTFIDSTGLRCLLEAYRRTETRGAEFVLTGASGPVENLLRLTGMDTQIPIAPDLETAVVHSP